MNYKKIIAFCYILLFTLTYASPLITIESKANLEPTTVKININPYTIIYEGDIVDCDIKGDPTIKYWYINNQTPHMTFYEDDPILFDPEPTPLDTNSVSLTVYAENYLGNASDTIEVIIKRIYFGDIHWHSRISDGLFNQKTMYDNAINDNYLDFVCLTDHAECIDGFDYTSPTSMIRDLFQIFINKIFRRTEWQMIKDAAIKYYDPGNFTTFLGFEYSSSQLHPGGRLNGPNGREDVSHVNFYYRDVYPDAGEYSAWDTYTYDELFQVMADEWDKGNLNIGFPHHPLMFNGFEVNTVNWTFLANQIKNTSARAKVLRGVETYSCWGTAIGQYSNLSISWPYIKERFYNQTDAWVENGLWEWSNNSRKNEHFALIASSDIHQQSRPGSAKSKTENNKKGFIPDNPAGLIAVYSVHNTRSEIWDAMNNCEMYGTQLLKIRANVRLNGQFAYGRWINCSSPLNITISACSTFLGVDRSGRSMCPYGYYSNNLNYPIQDVWLIKKDREKGRPWCKVIGHAAPNEHLTVVTFNDKDVQPNDFYWVAIRQKGQELLTGQNEYMTFIGPIFIDNVV